MYSALSRADEWVKRASAFPFSLALSPSLGLSFSSLRSISFLRMLFLHRTPALAALFIVGYPISHPYRERQIARRVISSSYCALT